MNTKGLYFAITLFVAIFLNSCGGPGSLKDKVPGWYESTIVYENGDSLKGKVTYYKNGQNKMEAAYIMHPIGGMRISAKIIIEGHWEVRNDELFETVDKVSATPKTLQEVIEAAMQKGKELPGSKIIKADELGLVLEDKRSKQTTYKRLKK